MTDRQSRRATLRVMRHHEPDEAIASQVAALRPFLGHGQAERRARLARMLRSERRAALTGIGYDPVRHAALHRLATETMADPQPAKTRKAAAPRATAFQIVGNRPRR